MNISIYEGNPHPDDWSDDPENPTTITIQHTGEIGFGDDEMIVVPGEVVTLYRVIRDGEEGVIFNGFRNITIH